MTGQDFHDARRRLGYSLRDMTIALGLSPGSVRTVRRYEKDGPPPRVAERVRGLLDAAAADASGPSQPEETA
tara:strand:+ start:13904 stop:14119 length:216 start_codon:yes stop_codon:yes gene_type:complete